MAPPERKTLHHGRLVDLGIEPVTLPNGERLELEVVRHPGGAAVVALDANGHVCLLRQYRHAGGGWLWELPAGKLEAREAPAQTAARELAEEAGVTARDWTPLGDCLTTPGFCDEVIHLYLARDLASTATRHEAHEAIEVHWIDFGLALAWAADGTLRDAKTLIGLWRAREVLR